MRKLADIIREFFAPNESEIKQAFTKRIDELDIEGVFVDDVSTDEGGDTLITFVDEEGSELDVLFTFDEDDGPLAIVIGEQEDDDIDGDEEEVEVVDLDTLEPPLINYGSGIVGIDLTDLNWMDDGTLEAILTVGDILQDTESDDSISERSAAVIRGGKRVRVALVRRKRKKRLTSKQRLAIRKGVRKRKTKKAQIARKRKKSLKIRRRLKLKKNTNRNLKVKGTASYRR